MAVLPDLATAADLTLFGYPVVDQTFLTRASSRVRRYTRQQISPGTSTVTIPGGSPFLLPQRPVVAVAKVVDSIGVELIEGASYELIGPRIFTSAPAPLTVTYDHGYADLPGDLIELVCSIATRLAKTPDALAAGVRQEQAGSEMVMWGNDAFDGTTSLLDEEKAVLRAMFPRLPRSARLL